MAAAPELLQQHRGSYDRAIEAASKLEDGLDEWAAVCYFYAALSAVRHALCADERLDGDAKARAVDPRLTAGSRHVKHHNGRADNRGIGLNQIVRIMYPKIASEYELLHTKSVEVRYGTGLVNATVSEVRGLLDTILAELRSIGMFPEVAEMDPVS